MTLLEMYIKDMNGCFQEPDRKGTTKGEEIGVYHNKYNAALHSLYSYEQKEIAQRAGISFSYYRKMRTEDNYKSFAKHIVNDFAVNFACLYLQKGSINKHTYATSVARTGLRIPFSIVIPTSADVESVFGDVANYSEELQYAIFNHIISWFKKLNTSQVLQTSDRIIYFLGHWNAPELNKTLFKAALESSNELICKILNNVNMTGEDRSNAAAVSHFILRLSEIL